MQSEKKYVLHLKIFLGLTLLFMFQASTKELNWPEQMYGSFNQPATPLFSLSLFKKEFKTRLNENLVRWAKVENTAGPAAIDEDWTYQVDYTVNPKLSSYIGDLLERFRSDYTSVVVIDNDTGEILSFVEYGRNDGFMGLDLTFSGVHPSASIFKIITTADLLRNDQVNKETVYSYLGRSTTLFKHQLNAETAKKQRWLRKETFQEAFARSNNVIFGKAVLQNNVNQSLMKTAKELGFEQNLMEELNLPISHLLEPVDRYGVAELATGFNRETSMTSIHAALLSLIVANDGILKYPKFVKNIKNKEDGKLIWGPKRKDKRVLSSSVALEIQSMMEHTVRKGTARKLYGQIDKRLRDLLYIGGKTGSITGGQPFGKRDWFTTFAIPASQDVLSGPRRGISICVMNINVNRWYVKSTHKKKKIIKKNKREFVKL